MDVGVELLALDTGVKSLQAMLLQRIQQYSLRHLEATM